MDDSIREPASFRDPSGFVFRRGGSLFRQVNRSYAAQYDRLVDSGLYRSLMDEALLIRHVEAAEPPMDGETAYKVLRPELVPFLSYPYEWCFSQLKDAALLTLAIQKRSLGFGISLKDCSAYNVQFIHGRPVFIDSLSFEEYREGHPWVAYRQFCQHFLAPLALMSRTDIRLNQLLRTNLDGIPLDLASRLLPARSWGRFGLLVHIHAHAKSQRRHGSRTVRPRAKGVSRYALLALLDSLERMVRRLHWRPGGTEWADYYDDTSYSSPALDRKGALVSAFIDRITPHTLWDLGANNGRFSRLSAARHIRTVAFDADPSCAEVNYLEVKRRGETHLLPLMLDLTNPSPGLGWAGHERTSLSERGPADALMALALIHHLAIGNNVPLEHIADHFRRLGRWLVIEFVPKEDPQVGRLLVSREDIFDRYTRRDFEASFSRHFTIEHMESILDSGRSLYLMRSRNRE